MYGYIYMTTNKLNGLIYIGQKHSDIFLGNKYLGSGKKLHLAVAKYGEEAFEVHLVERVDTKESMDAREIYWIAKYNSTRRDIGYNISTGGNVNRRFVGENNPFYNKKHSEVTRQKMREHSPRLSGRNHPNYGNHLSEETKRKIGDANRGRIKTEAEKQKRLDTLKQRGGHRFWITDEYCAKLSKSLKGKNTHSKGRKHINNGVEAKMITLDELDKYLSEGWVLGRLPFSDETRKKFSEAQKGRAHTLGKVWVTNGIISHFISPEEFDKYSNLGYHRGRTLHPYTK